MPAFDREWIKFSEGPWARRRKHQVVVLNNKIIILGGFAGETAANLNDVWVWDGESWEEVCGHAEWSGRDGHSAVVLNNSILVLGGTDDPYMCKSDVWQSHDGGSTWNRLVKTAAWPERWQHASCMHEGKIYLTGGWGDIYLNDVWSSRDGFNWIQVCASAPWKPRMFHSVVSFKGALYVIGGHDGRSQLRDVWASSDDGESWTQVCHAAQWQGRQGSCAVVVNDHVYLMGGFGGSSRFNDVWQSSDCSHWSEVMKSSLWSPRQGHAAAALNGDIYLFGGFDETGYCNDSYLLHVSQNNINVSRILEKMDSGHSQHSNEERAPKVITVSLLCVMESIALLRRQRRQYDGIIQGMVTVVALVTNTLNFRPTSQPKELQLTLPRTYRNTSAASADPFNHVVCNVELSSLSADSPLVDSSSATSGGLGIPHVDTAYKMSRRGSPFRNQITECPNSIKSFKSAEDFQNMTWQQVVPAAAEHTTPQNSPRPSSARLSNSGNSTEGDGAEPDDSGVDYATPREGGLPIEFIANLGQSNKSSAALQDSMNKDRSELKKLQSRIRMAAEADDVGLVESLCLARTNLALGASSQVDELSQYLASISKFQTNRQKDMHDAMQRLLELACLLTEKTNKTQISTSTTNGTGLMSGNRRHSEEEIEEKAQYQYSSWENWESVLESTSKVMHLLDSSIAETAIHRLAESFKVTAKISAQATDWLYADEANEEENASNYMTREIEKLQMNQQDVASQKEDLGALSFDADDGDVPQQRHQLPKDETEVVTSTSIYGVMCEAFDHSIGTQDKLRMKVKLEVDREMDSLRGFELKAIDCLTNSLKHGQGLLRNMIQQNSIDLMEISSLLQEVKSWQAKVDQLKNLDVLNLKITEIIAENSELEDQLLKLEDSKLDLKFALEKSILQGNRRKERNSHASTASEDHSSKQAAGAALSRLREELLLAEKAANKARRTLRTWYRINRPFAIEVGPELFHHLPDFRSLGAVLGDGGFAENAKLPRRLLEEYDEVETFNKNTNTTMTAMEGGGAKQTGRHMMLKAKYDDDDVILKGFVMQNYEQRKGFDAEIGILAKLHSSTIISPRALVEGSSSSEDPTVFIEYPFIKGGNLNDWLKAGSKKPWELQQMARQILYALVYLHDQGVIHRDIKPSNILRYEDGRIVLSDFELSRFVGRTGGSSIPTLSIEDEDEVERTRTRSGTRGFMAPEIESGGLAYFASDMYSFGVLLYYMHFPTHVANLIPGKVRFPASSNQDPELVILITKLLEVDPTQRPSAAEAVMFPYFRVTFVDRLMQDGEVVEQDRKLEAVRNLIQRTKAANRGQFDQLTVHRDRLFEDVLDYFLHIPLDRIRKLLRVTFVDEPGIDEGGLLTEMFYMFFDQAFQPSSGIFEGSDGVSLKSGGGNGNADDGDGEIIVNEVVLPCAANTSVTELKKLEAFGRAIVKALYEGRRLGGRLCPSVFKFITDSPPSMRDLQMFDPQQAKSLQWMLATVGVEEFGLHYESVDAPELGPVTDANKAKFVRMKIEHVLVKCRIKQLQAIKTGFAEALKALSEEAAPFLSLLSHTDWRVMLCGDFVVSAQQIVAACTFTGFPNKSETPQWFKEILLASSEDHLRKFLVFVTGSPSLSPLSSSRSKSVTINVRHQNRTGSLPIAHTCFFQLDIPIFKDKETLQSKLLYSVQNANTFEIV